MNVQPAGRRPHNGSENSCERGMLKCFYSAGVYTLWIKKHVTLVSGITFAKLPIFYILSLLDSEVKLSKTIIIFPTASSYVVTLPRAIQNIKIAKNMIHLTQYHSFLLMFTKSGMCAVDS